MFYLGGGEQQTTGRLTKSQENYASAFNVLLHHTLAPSVYYHFRARPPESALSEA